MLLKYLHQTTAVDMWAAGVVLLCVLSGCYPFFKSPSDLAALVEIISIFGSDAVGEIASKFGKHENIKKVCSVYPYYWYWFMKKYFISLVLTSISPAVIDEAACYGPVQYASNFLFDSYFLLGRRVLCSGARVPLDLKKMCRRLRNRKTKKDPPPSKGKCENCLQHIRDDGCVCRTVSK